MKTFLTFLQEGGNVVIDDKEAGRIDLTKVDRNRAVDVVNRTLIAFNNKFKKEYGIYLWNADLFHDKSFLSGSSFAFFDKSIEKDTFVKHKKSVGDIDAQVDKMQAANLGAFLAKHKGDRFAYGTLVGHKKSTDYITLFEFPTLGVNVQIDLELVDYDKQRPTEWSIFSRSSSWEDMSEGIKGVFHKYLLRSLTSVAERDVILLKGKRETPTKTAVKDFSFSVVHGLRQAIEPVMDGDKIKKQGGLEVWREIPSKGAYYENNLGTMFKMLFGKDPKGSDLKKFGSFTGILQLINENLPASDRRKVMKDFAEKLWGDPGKAQRLYRGEPEKDLAEKKNAWDHMSKILKMKYDTSKMRAHYYENYK